MSAPSPDGPPSSFLDSLGARASRRAEPRTSIAIAGAGCALAVLGVLIVAGDTGSSGGDFNKVPGIVLSALVVAAGFFTLSSARQGAAATAGTVAAALGVPALVFFLTFDQDGLPPYSTDAILIVSTIVWLGAYLVGPGRGRPFFLGAGLIGAWFTLLQLTEDVFDFPFAAMGGWFAYAPTDELGPGAFGVPRFDAPDPTTLGLLSLGLGGVYMAATRRLDTRGRHGTATPFALAALPTLFAGTLLLSDDLEQAGTGLLLALLGASLAYHGSTVGRRATAWVGGGATALGAAVFLADMTDDATIGGMLFLAAGIGLVAGGHAAATALREPDEMAVTIGGPPDLIGRSAPVSVAPYAAGWSPPSDAAQPVEPGHWNPPVEHDPGPPPPPPAPEPPAPASDPEEHSQWAPPEDPAD
jgi:hypothetical protein